MLRLVFSTHQTLIYPSLYQISTDYPHRCFRLALYSGNHMDMLKAPWVYSPNLLAFLLSFTHTIHHARPFITLGCWSGHCRYCASSRRFRQVGGEKIFPILWGQWYLKTYDAMRVQTLTFSQESGPEFGEKVFPGKKNKEVCRRPMERQDILRN
jgi:hypothetical protein